MKFGFQIIVLFACLCRTVFLHEDASENDVIVEIDLGKIKGSIMKTVHNRDIKAFRGIPYAKPPIGDLRFRPPVKVGKWNETVLDATKNGHICPQPYIDQKLISEDCLILNVYTRDLKGNKPVIFFIHGGSNYLGSSHSDLEGGPQYIMDYDIVLVTINYRLGPFGFLTTRSPEAPGNYGILDQLMALQWTHDYISNFGGNPESVTIMGLSAGSMDTTVHMASPLSKGLFHRVILMAGASTNHYQVDSVGMTRDLAKFSGCPRYNPKDVIDCMRNVSWEKIIQGLSIFEAYNFVDVKWNYEVDGHVLLDTPTNIFADGKFNKVPIIAGIAKDELAYFVYSQENNDGLFNDISLNFEKYAPELFTFSPDDEKSKQLQKFYLKNKDIKDQPLNKFGEIFSDAVIGHGIYRLVHLARRYVDVYYYRFDYIGRSSLIVDHNGKPRGCGHADEFQYIMGHYGFMKYKPGDVEMFMVERICKWWTTFAEKGKPENDEVKWLPCNATHVYTMYNNKELKLGDEPYLERYTFWDSLFPIKNLTNEIEKN